MRVLIWHHHGSWTTSFVQGDHTYLVPVVPGRGPDGRGRAATWDWPDRVEEVAPADLAGAPVDVVVVQRQRDLDLARRWLARPVPGPEVAVVWLEHNTPKALTGDARHPAADRRDVTVVHVTHANARLWDTGSAPTTVIEHGVLDPGLRFRGDRPGAVAVINEPVRRGRAVGADLLGGFAEAAPLEVCGIDAGALGEHHGLHPVEGLAQDDLHHRMARSRVYVHPYRWTSLGLSLLEAMLLGLPVVALSTTEVPRAVPPEAGVVSNDLDELHRAVACFTADVDRAAAAGRAGRLATLDRYGLPRFLGDWDRLLQEVTA